MLAAPGADGVAAPDGEVADEEVGKGETDTEGAMDGADEDMVATYRGTGEASKTAEMESAADLTMLDVAINNNPDFHTFGTINTKIYVCRICNRRMLGLAAAIHRHEVHEVHYQEKAEECKV